MINAVADPSFEGVGWSYLEGAWPTTDNPHTGSRCAALVIGAGAFVPGQVAQSGIALFPTRLYYPQVYVRREGSPTGPLVIELDLGDGNLVEYGRVEATTPLAWTLYEFDPFRAAGPTGVVRVRSASPLPVAEGYCVDDVGLLHEGALVTTDDTREWLLADLADVSGLNVYEAPRDRRALTLPGAVLTSPLDGSDEPASMTAIKGQAAQRFGVELHLQGTDSELCDLLDQVRNAVGRRNGNLNSQNRVDYGLVVEWNDVSGSDFARGEFHKMTLTVEVAYIYERGSL